MAHLEEMPLFPLHTVLFPYAQMRLHVFEERYREMVRFCTEFDRPFGVVLIRHGEEVGETAEPYMVGTAARIQQVQTFDDGRMDIQIYGERRFRVRKFDESKPYLVGMVEPVVEVEPEEPERLDALTIKSEECFRLWIEGQLSREDLAVQVVFPQDPLQVSFLIADYMPLENSQKQIMLETTDTAERLASLIPILEQQMRDQTDMAFRVTTDTLKEWMNPN
ncbi:MAG: LON peptidase substrate-binding domain-containing protein [Armatimonadetes bacterium]|nr:LON peptidase substrate-binding domain-containing protein [Armatimonadota bacterium]